LRISAQPTDNAVEMRMSTSEQEFVFFMAPSLLLSNDSRSVTACHLKGSIF
jgi:hypothetical protein